MWDLLARLHRAGLALRDVSIARFGADAEGRIGLRDLSTTGLSGPDEGPLDRAQLLVATAQHLGIDAATRIAAEHLGHDAMAALVPYVQSAALGPTLRSELRAVDDPVDVDDLRDRIAELSGVESPDLAELRRVSPASLVQMALMTFAAYAIISLLGGVDPDELVATLSGAALGWVALALVVGQLPVLTETVSTQGASTRRLAVGPLVALQAAIGFVKLAIPSTAARMAMIVRYFQKQGVPPRRGALHLRDRDLLRLRDPDRRPGPDARGRGRLGVAGPVGRNRRRHLRPDRRSADRGRGRRGG